MYIQMYFSIIRSYKNLRLNGDKEMKTVTIKLLILCVLSSLLMEVGCSRIWRKSDKKKIASHHIEMGSSYLSQANYNQAELEFKEAVFLDPYNADSHNLLGMAYFHQERYLEAQISYQSAITLDSNSSDPHYNLGRVYEKLR